MKRTSAVVVTTLATALLATTAHSGPTQFIYYGPTPYLEFADSPFVASDGVFGFCNETFEDASFDVPGVTGNGAVVSPANNIDSVDGDDGAIDGSGQGGHSYFNIDGANGITFTFDPDRTHGLPTKVGIVWTDGGQNTTVTFEGFDATGASLGVQGPFDHPDGQTFGTTAEDRFYGVSSPAGISAVKLANPSGGIEVDHLQLNRCVSCGDTNIDLRRTATDALGVLQTAVGLSSCDDCICDVNGSGSISASDALVVLQDSVGVSQPMDCPPCTLSSTTTTTTTLGTTTTSTVP